MTGDAPDGEATWIARAEAALEGRPADDVRVLATARPPFLDVAVGLVSVPLAATVGAGAALRETVAGSPLDPFALLLRALAFGLALRAARALWRFAGRVRLATEARRHGLAIASGGLLYRTPAGDVAVAARDVLGVRERGDWRTRARARAEPVYVLRRTDAGPLHLAIPPVFAGGPGVVAEALMRLPRPPGTEPSVEPPDRGTEPLPSRLYDDAARGAPAPGVVAIRHGRAWLARAPRATVLLGLAILEGLARAAPSTQAVVAPVGLAAGLVAAVLWPALWALGAWRHVRPRKGLSLVLTPAALLLRTRAGVWPIPWTTLARARVEGRATWTLHEGPVEATSLVLERRGEEPIRYDEHFLGAPADLVALLVEAYRRGALGADRPGRVLALPPPR